MGLYQTCDGIRGRHMYHPHAGLSRARIQGKDKHPVHTGRQLGMAYEEGSILFKTRQRDQITNVTVLQEMIFHLSGLYDNILNWVKSDKSFFGAY